MKKKTSTLVLIAGCIALATVSAAAQAGRFADREGGFAGSGGRTGSWSQHVERERGSLSRQGSITTDQGRTFTRSKERLYDRETGSVSGSTTGFRGNTRTYEGDYDRETGVYERDITGSRGRTLTATSTYDRETKTRESTYTGEQGRTATSTSARNDEGGRTTTLVGPRENEATRETSNSWDEETGTLTHSVTGPKGETRSVDLFVE